MRFEDQRVDVPQKRSAGERLVPWVVLSLIVHAILVAKLAPTILEGEWWKGDAAKEAAAEAERKSMKTRLMPSEAAVALPPKAAKAVQEARKALEAAQAAPKPEEKKPEPTIPRPDGQIVDIAKPQKEEAPDKADYLSSYDSKVKKETRAKKTAPTDQVAPQFDKGQMRAPEGPIGTKEDRLVVGQEEKPTLPGKAGTSDRLLIPDMKPSGPVTPAPPHDPAAVPIPGGRRFQEGLRGNADRLAMIFKPGQDGQQGMDAKTPGGLNIPKSLMPDLGLTFREGGAPMNDHLRGVEEGEGTWLNTKAFKYASYFNRIKLKIAQRWHPDAAQQHYDPTFSIYGTQNRYTVVYIELDGSSGGLMLSDIQRSSGVDYLDREALSAVQSAAPFVNPPKGLADNDGKIKFPFGFYFELSRAGIRLR